jgi:hypothetical protein
VTIEDEADNPIPLVHDPCQSSAIFYQSGFPGSSTLDSQKYMARVFPWQKFLSDGGTVGNVLSFQTFGHVIVVLNTADAAKDLLEKRAAIYSDRSAIPFHEMYVSEFCIQSAIFG